jgi:hypothetical protein
MPTTSTARIANDSPFCEASAAMGKIVDRLLGAGRHLVQDRMGRTRARWSAPTDHAARTPGPPSATAHATAPHPDQVVGTVADDAVVTELHPMENRV